jgi:MinD superfamily P-loop ATPase
MTKPTEITIISGKGGTGKTVLTSSMAALVRHKVMADCDVDAPDLHLLLRPEIVRREIFMGKMLAGIDTARCTGCGRCIEVCRYGAVVQAVRGGRGVYDINSMDCEGCGVCAWTCPENAISLTETAGGTWFISETRFGKMVHASLGVAQENSGKLVTIVRREARMLAIQEGLRYVIIDGPPGIGCPVIASVAGADLAVIVTEPTLSGMHDLERVLGLAGHFGIQAAAVINKHDLNPETTVDLEAFLERRSVPLLGKIPFSDEVNRALVDCRLVVEASDGDVAGEIRKVAAGILDLVNGNRAGRPTSKRIEGG